MERYIKCLMSLGLIVLLGALVGCQNSTGQLLSPSSDIHVAGINPVVFQPREKDGKIELPLMQVYFRVNNGISAFMEQYTIHYYTVDGTPLANGRYDVSGAMNMFIQAPEIKTFDAQESDDSGGGDSSDSSASIRAQDSGGSETQQTIPSDVAGYTTLEVYPPAIYQYLTRDNSDVTDDIMPVIARITIHGRDLNDKEVTMTTQGTLTTTVLKES